MRELYQEAREIQATLKLAREHEARIRDLYEEARKRVTALEEELATLKQRQI